MMLKERHVFTDRSLLPPAAPSLLLYCHPPPLVLLLLLICCWTAMSKLETLGDRELDLLDRNRASTSSLF
jgi:hypothetical protein